MLGKYTKAYGEIESAVKPILEGQIVCIDPSIGSSSSMPGWAVYRAGLLVDSGTFSINPNQSIPDRLRTLNGLMRKLYNVYTPDVLCYEDIPPLRQGGGNATSHASLLKAVGAILCIPGPDHYVGIQPISWKKMVREEYRKGDEEDAIELGWIIIQEAARISKVVASKKPNKKGK